MCLSNRSRLRRGQFRGNLDDFLIPRHRRDHQLGDAHGAGDGERPCAEIGKDHLHLAAKVIVDGAGVN